MTYIGKVANGTVVLPPDAHLPEGAEVLVEWDDVKTAKDQDMPVGKKLLTLAGIAKGLPEDLAENHDHYLHGTPKRAGA